MRSRAVVALPKTSPRVRVTTASDWAVLKAPVTADHVSPRAGKGASQPNTPRRGHRPSYGYGGALTPRSAAAVPASVMCVREGGFRGAPMVRSPTRRGHHTAASGTSASDTVESQNPEVVSPITQGQGQAHVGRVQHRRVVPHHGSRQSGQSVSHQPRLPDTRPTAHYSAPSQHSTQSIGGASQRIPHGVSPGSSLPHLSPSSVTCHLSSSHGGGTITSVAPALPSIHHAAVRSAPSHPHPSSGRTCEARMYTVRPRPKDGTSPHQTVPAPFHPIPHPPQDCHQTRERPATATGSRPAYIPFTAVPGMRQTGREAGGRRWDQAIVETERERERDTVSGPSAERNGERETSLSLVVSPPMSRSLLQPDGTAPPSLGGHIAIMPLEDARLISRPPPVDDEPPAPSAYVGGDVQTPYGGTGGEGVVARPSTAPLLVSEVCSAFGSRPGSPPKEERGDTGRKTERESERSMERRRQRESDIVRLLRRERQRDRERRDPSQPPQRSGVSPATFFPDMQPLSPTHAKAVEAAPVGPSPKRTPQSTASSCCASLRTPGTTPGRVQSPPLLSTPASSASSATSSAGTATKQVPVEAAPSQLGRDHTVTKAEGPPLEGTGAVHHVPSVPSAPSPPEIPTSCGPRPFSAPHPLLHQSVLTRRMTVSGPPPGPHHHDASTASVSAVVPSGRGSAPTLSLATPIPILGSALPNPTGSAPGTRGPSPFLAQPSLPEPQGPSDVPSPAYTMLGGGFGYGMGDLGGVNPMPDMDMAGFSQQPLDAHPGFNHPPPPAGVPSTIPRPVPLLPALTPIHASGEAILSPIDPLAPMDTTHMDSVTGVVSPPSAPTLPSMCVAPLPPLSAAPLHAPSLDFLAIGSPPVSAGHIPPRQQTPTASGYRSSLACTPLPDFGGPTLSNNTKPPADTPGFMPSFLPPPPPPPPLPVYPSSGTQPFPPSYHILPPVAPSVFGTEEGRPKRERVRKSKRGERYTEREKAKEKPKRSKKSKPIAKISRNIASIQSQKEQAKERERVREKDREGTGRSNNMEQSLLQIVDIVRQSPDLPRAPLEILELLRIVTTNPSFVRMQANGILEWVRGERPPSLIKSLLQIKESMSTEWQDAVVQAWADSRKMGGVI
ncbi:hypothetical protein KIPB_007123 [Kipferlia bialata]|uniref:Uncharacterized protein n=1 Tax=Kipferlia bialata TaxID=797122 RepID=A0A9K3CY91_9EUKA|nr:hypothetical protein KIPB_007123 [Kipferlia bialata]|eukprot:g7123.t1